MRTSPRQWTITIRKVEKLDGETYGMVTTTAFVNAERRLSPNYAALTLWTYFSLQRDGYPIMSGVNGPLSVLKLNPKAYHSGMAKLREEGFLTPDPDHPRTAYTFTQYPEDHREKRSKPLQKDIQNTSGRTFKTPPGGDENSMSYNTSDITNERETSYTSDHSVRMIEQKKSGPEAMEIVGYMDRVGFDHSTIDNVDLLIGAALHDGVKRGTILSIIDRGIDARNPGQYLISALTTERRCYC